MRFPFVALALAVSFVLLARPARAYSIESVITVGCHERLAQSALRAVRADTPQAAAVPPPTADDRALVKDVPFTLDTDLTELAAAALLIGLRDNDLRGRGPGELDHLSEVHGSPEDQRRHCLRARDEDEPDGTARAVADCRAFVRERVADALDGLDASGRPDPAARTTLHVVLGIRGGVDAVLPRYWVAIGQAMHTVQDSFSHSFRSIDRTRIRASLNWIDWVERAEVESRDGPVHRNELDACDDLDALRQRGYDLALEASSALLRTTLDPALDRAGKLAAVDALLDRYLGVEAGCTAANGWCDAPERSYAISPSCGCALPGLARSGPAAVGVALGLGAALVARRRRTAAALVGGALLVARPAAAEPARIAARAEPTAAEPVASPAPVASPPASSGAEPQPFPAPPGVPTPDELAQERIERTRARTTRWGIYGAVSGSVTNPALNGQLGVRLRLSERWEIGLDGELNNWFAIHTSTFRTGAFNAYATAILRFPLRFEAINLRTTANLGTSVLLIDLYGAPRGSVGIYAGLTPLGVEWKLGQHAYLVFDALGIALPVPNLKGVPFVYPQYRSSLGLEVAF